MLSEVTLALVTIASAWGLTRLLDGSDYLLPIMAAAALGHLAAAALRRFGLPSLTVPLAMVGGLVLLVTWGYYRDTTVFGFPTSATIDMLGTDLRFAWEQFGDIKAPAPALTGFVITSVSAVWCIAFLADTIAFRVWVSIEAVAPALVMLVFVSMVGTDSRQVFLTLVVVLAMLAFLMFHRLFRQDRTVNWLAEDNARGTGTLLRSGLILVALATLLAAIVGPRLPGSEAAAWDWEAINDEPEGRVVQSPLVSIRDRLVNQQNIEAFQVTTNSEAYWRTMSLDEFTGTIWRAQGKYNDVSGDLPGGDVPAGDTPSAGTEAITQTYTITNLNQLWMPAALQARSIDILAGNADEARYHPESSTLTVGLDREFSDGLSYEVMSEVPLHDAALLRNPPTDSNGEPLGIPSAIAERYLGLPSDFSPMIADEAVRVAGSQATTFDQALALQNHFRDNFNYNINVAFNVTNKHSTSVMEEFVRVQEGYCEQFAGTFAAMARSLGIPARVAVGYTQGELLSTNPDNGLSTYSVQGRHGHAWPEVYIAGFGWVPFEPTPGRGLPGRQGLHTGQDPAQDTSLEDAAGEVPASTTTTTAPAATDGETQEQATAPTTTVAPDRAAGTPVSAGTPSEPGWWVGPLRVIGAALLLFGLYAGAVVGWRRWKRWQRHQQATTANKRARAAWADALDELDHVGARPQRHETHSEFAARAAVLLPESDEPTEVLATHLSAANYRADGLGDAEADECQAAAGQIATLVRSETSTARRSARALKPPSISRN